MFPISPSTFCQNRPLNAIHANIMFIQFLEESPDFKKLATIAQQKGPEAEKLARETWDEIHKILEKKYKEAEEVAEDAKKEAKK